MSSACVELDRVGNLDEQRQQQIDAGLTLRRRHQRYPNGRVKKKTLAEIMQEITQQKQPKRKKRKVKKREHRRRRPIMAAFTR
jgi:hypothetical protein